MSGNPERLIFGYDDQGNICGVDNTMLTDVELKNPRDLTYVLVGDCEMTHSDRKYLYYADYTDPDVQICVKECPTETYIAHIGSLTPEYVYS